MTDISYTKLNLPKPSIVNGQPLFDVPRDQLAVYATTLATTHQLPLSLMYATDERVTDNAYMVHAAFAHDDTGSILTLRTRIPADDLHYPSLTKTIMAAQWYERLIGDQFGIVATGHPDWRRLIHHENIPADTYPLRKDFAWNTKLPHAQEPYPLHKVEGHGIFEIPVGPIHAGIIEPGHFRFNVRGERILTLEGKLFFTHKGVEKLLEGKSITEALPFIERITGNMPVAHTIAYCQAVETATNTQIPRRAAYLRSFLNELERITMHVFDIGNMAGNGTGFTFMAAQGFRIHEELRRLSEQITGHRFLRGVIIPGGLVRDIDTKTLHSVQHRLNTLKRDLDEVIDVAYATDGLMERLETTGILTKEAALAYGGVGLPARASGIKRDIRHMRPYAAYTDLQPSICTKTDGDVRARFDMRVLELTESFKLIQRLVASIPNGDVHTTVSLRAGSSYGWSEGWLGEVLTWVRLDEQGNIDRCVVRDPSFCNWPLFGEIGPGNIVPDFPLCNKSLNLSYSGADM